MENRSQAEQEIVKGMEILKDADEDFIDLVVLKRLSGWLFSWVERNNRFQNHLNEWWIIDLVDVYGFSNSDSFGTAVDKIDDCDCGESSGIIHE